MFKQNLTMTGFDPETFVNCATTIAKPMVVKIVLFSFNYSFKNIFLKITEI